MKSAFATHRCGYSYFATSLLVLFLSCRASAQRFTVTDLGTLGGTQSYSYGVNVFGQAVGSSYLKGDSAYNAFIYDTHNGGMKPLGTLGGSSSTAYGINLLGQVVGGCPTDS